MISHKKVLKLLVLLSFFFISCEKKEAFSYERPLFTINNVLKDEYLGLFFQDMKMGYFHGSAYEVTVKDKKGFYVSGDAVIKIVMENDNLYTVLKEEVLLDENLKTLYFNYSQKIGDSSLNIIAKKQGSAYAMKTTSSGKPEEAIVAEEFLPLGAAGFIVWKNGISEGKSYHFQVFVEAMQKTEQLDITIGKKQFEDGKAVFPVNQKLGNIEITSYVLENGETYKEQSIQGFTMRKMEKKEALKFDEKAPSFYDLFSFSLVPVDRDLSGEFSKLTVIASNFDTKAKIESTEYQKVEKVEDGYKITVSKTRLFDFAKPKNLAPYLANTAKIQSEDPTIKSLAKSITKDAKSDIEKAEIIVRWVNKNINKRLKDKASALDVLLSKEGECEAHSMLVAALLRSIGIPAKIVGGVVYSRENKGFLYHAWNEVWIDNHFLPVDATFGEFPAKPYHIKLTEEKNMEDVVLFLGRLKLHIISVE